MTKQHILWILSVITVMVMACKPKPVNPPEDPQPGSDTTKQDTTKQDTTKHDTIPIIPTIDTVRIDTVTFDSVINLTNDRVVCSYVDWYCDQNKVLGLYKYVTHICFAFAELYVVDSVYQKFDLSGGTSSWNLFKKVVALKQKNPDLKIQLSFSHVVENTDENSQQGGFSAMAKSQEQMSHFAHDCKEFCKKWNLDGIDIDWELPGLSWSNHACDPAVDTENHVKLMKTLRDTLPAGEYLLTYAGYPKDKRKITGGWQFVDNKAVEPYVDWINVMTYDLGSGSHPHSAMYCTAADWDILRTWQAFNAIGFPMNKMVLGIPFYGRVSFDSKPEVYDYYIIQNNLSSGKWTRKYHNLWQVPYVVDKSGSMICSYDDAQSIAYKANWAISKGMRGLMWWSQGGDDGKKTLTQACWNGMKTERQTWQYYIIHLSDSTTITTEPVYIPEQPK